MRIVVFVSGEFQRFDSRRHKRAEVNQLAAAGQVVITGCFGRRDPPEFHAVSRSAAVKSG